MPRKKTAVGHDPRAAHSHGADGGPKTPVAQFWPVTLARSGDERADLIGRVTVLARQRRQYLNAVLVTENQMRAMKKWHGDAEWFDPTYAHMEAFADPTRLASDRIARQMGKIAAKMHVAGWVAQQRGFGLKSFAEVIAETGDLDAYDNPAKVWKRMGLAVGDDGKGQRRQRGAAGVLAGFSPRRRALMHVIGECLIKLNDGIYRQSYDERKAYELARDPEMKPIHAHKRAMRFMEKRLLRDLWRAWRGQNGDDAHPPIAAPNFSHDLGGLDTHSVPVVAERGLVDGDAHPSTAALVGSFA